LPSDAFPRLKICQKYVCGRGSAPDPAGGAHSAPPDPLAGFKGLLLREGEEKGGMDRTEGEEREGEGREGKRRGGKGRDGGLTRHLSLLSAAPAYNNKS